MKKRVTNEDVAKVIGDTASKIRIELENDLRRAKYLMLKAEEDLLKTLTEEQKQKYFEINKYREICSKVEKDLA